MKKLAALTAAVLVAQQIGIAPAAADAPSAEQIRTVAQLARANAVPEIRAYVAANPELVSAESPIASLLAQLSVPERAPQAIDALNRSLAAVDAGRFGAPAGTVDATAEGSDAGPRFGTIY